MASVNQSPCRPVLFVHNEKAVLEEIEWINRTFSESCECVHDAHKAYVPKEA